MDFDIANKANRNIENIGLLQVGILEDSKIVKLLTINYENDLNKKFKTFLPHEPKMKSTIHTLCNGCLLCADASSASGAASELCSSGQLALTYIQLACIDKLRHTHTQLLSPLSSTAM